MTTDRGHLNAQFENIQAALQQTRVAPSLLTRQALLSISGRLKQELDTAGHEIRQSECVVVEGEFSRSPLAAA